MSRNEIVAAKNQSIVCGGGWKTPPKEYHLKIKAIGGALLTVVSIVGGSYYYEAFGVPGFLPAVVLFISSILLSRFERPITFFITQHGAHDIRNLY
jgi:hypothetical protein